VRYLLDLDDGGPLVECRDAHQASALGALWLAVRLQRDPAYAVTMAVRIRALARAAQDMSALRSGRC